MSTDAQPPTSDNDDPSWRPSSSSMDSDRREAVSGIRNGFDKVIEGASEAISYSVLLVLLVVFWLLGKNNEETTPEERSAEWNARAKPIQERFEANDVDEDDVEDAIAWARSQE